MNERIKELMAQAGFDPAALERMGIMPQVEKCVGLIIRDCIDSISNIEEQFFNARIAATDFTDKNRFAEAETACEMSKRKIEMHFGVEL